MKVIKKIKTVVFLGILFCYMGCVQDNEFEVPKVNEEENIALNEILEAITNGEIEEQTITQIKNLYTSGETPIEIVSDIVVKGYVVSSDREGNFYREIYLQDAPENPTTGIKVILNMNNSYTKYNIGRVVYILLKGLYIGETNSGDNIITIGGKVNTDNNLEVDIITQNQIEDFVFRSEITSEIIPKTVLANAIGRNDIGTFISLEDCAFEESVVGEPYVDPNEDFDTKRILQVCQGLGFYNVLVESSSFSLFANNAIPNGGGVVSGIFTKDFGGDVFVLALNTIDDVVFEDSRCQPIDATDFFVILEEGFESTSGDIDIEGWTNYKEVGTRFWDSYEDEDTLSTAADIGSFFSRNESTIGWLITPAINLDNTTQEFLSFETSNSFADRSELEVLISTDWNGNEDTITTATWQNLPATIVDDAISFEHWISSGYVDLSAYTGTVYIAFKYTGSGDEDYDGTYELDNIKIEGK